MCYPTRCKQCSKTTWAGCGEHVADVRSSVPAQQWCPGHANPVNDSWLRRLIGRQGDSGR